MFGKSVIVLKTGMLYNVIACLLVAAAALAAAVIFFGKRKQRPDLLPIFVFLALLSITWFLRAAVNLFGWLGRNDASMLAANASRLSQISSMIPLFLFSVNKTVLERSSKLLLNIYGYAAGAFLLFSAFLFWGGEPSMSYWGQGWAREMGPDIFSIALLVIPIGILAVIELTRIFNDKRAVVFWASILSFSILGAHDFVVQNIHWATLLVRLLYIACVFGITISIKEEKREDFASVSLKEALRSVEGKPRFPFFLKLLGIFVLLSVIPIALFGALMFTTFKEIIDLYIYKPLLWNLKTSRTEFLTALKNIQIQVWMLMGLTISMVLMVSSVVSRRISGELKRIGSGMKKISEGDLSIKIIPSSNDEIGDLVSYFDVMAEEIKAAREKLENWNRELERKVEERTKDLREAMERLMELDKLKTQFISMISHELRTPLTAINGFTTQFIQGKTGPMNEIQMKFLSIMKDSEKRLLGLIDGLLDYANMETGKFSVEKSPQAIDLIIRGTVDGVRDHLEGKGVKISVKTGAPTGKFMGDENRIKQVLINLIDNAAKFSAESAEIEISSTIEGDEIIVSVKDSGIGIERERVNKIFEKFYQIDTSFTRKFGGVGLGLTIAKEIVDAHGGRIWAESEGAGKGTTFKFAIPLSK
jgi:signal transduction histidine kinase